MGFIKLKRKVCNRFKNISLWEVWVNEKVRYSKVNKFK